jgi:heme O synthase-like polyprenyltransferase
MTEEETWDLMTHLRTKWGRKVLILLLVSAILIFIGLDTLPYGVVAIAAGIVILAYGLHRQLKSEERKGEREQG